MTILITGIILIIISLLNHRKYSPYWGFLFVLLIMGLQSGVEGDYYGYFNSFKKAQTWGTFNYHDTEIGWYLLVKLLSFSSFSFFIFVISFLQYLILSKFATKYIARPYQYVAAILFFLTFSFMLLQMKAIRQGLALELCVAAFMYVDKKKFWILSLLTFAAYSIHNTSLIIAPFSVLFYFSKKFNWFEKKIIKKDFYYPIIWTAIFLVVYALKATILNKYLMPMIYSNELLRFSGYFKDIEYQFDISLLIVLYDALMVFTVTWYYKYASPSLKFFSILTIIAAFSDMLLFGLGSLPRTFLYFSIFNIVVYPNVAYLIKRKFGSIVSFAYIVICIAYAFKTSLPWMLETSGGRFGTFKFIFQ